MQLLVYTVVNEEYSLVEVVSEDVWGSVEEMLVATGDAVIYGHIKK